MLLIVYAVFRDKLTFKLKNKVIVSTADAKWGPSKGQSLGPNGPPFDGPVFGAGEENANDGTCKETANDSEKISNN